MGQIVAITAELLLGTSLFAVFFLVYYVDGLRDDWDTQETNDRIKSAVRCGRLISIILLLCGVVCLGFSWGSFRGLDRNFSIAGALLTACLLGLHFWTPRQKDGE